MIMDASRSELSSALEQLDLAACLRVPARPT